MRMQQSYRHSQKEEQTERRDVKGRGLVRELTIRSQVGQPAVYKSKDCKDGKHERGRV